MDVAEPLGVLHEHPGEDECASDWSGSERGSPKAAEPPGAFKTDVERLAYWESKHRLRFLKPSFDNTPGLRRALGLHDATHAAIYGVYILDIRYSFADVDSLVARASAELSRSFRTRHVHVLENENVDSCVESFLGIEMSKIPSFPSVYVVAPTGVFAYAGSVSSAAARADAVWNIQRAF